MNWILGVCIVLIIIFLLNNRSKKRKLVKLKHRLLKEWGKPKTESYYNFDIIGEYFNNNEHKGEAFHLISDKTQQDLDINEIFKFIDRTTSRIGQQYLYFKLRTIGNIKDLLAFDKLTTVFLRNKNIRIESQLELSKLNTRNAYDLERLIHEDKIEKSKLLWLAYSLTVVTLLLIGLGFYYPISFLFIVPIFITNLILHFSNKNNINHYLSGINQISRALEVAKNLAKFKEIKAHYNTFPFLKKIERIKLKTEFLGFNVDLSNEYIFAIWMMIESFKILFNIEYILFNSFLDDIKSEKQSIEALFLFIGEIDAAISTASLKSSDVTLCTPEFIKSKKISTEKIIHPLIKNCIPNNLELNNKSMLLTGSNMSGKTTFIRTVAVNSILAQTLNLCFAKAYKAPFFKVYSSIRITDDLFENTSYYLEEVLTLKTLIDASQEEPPCLFVLDEIFKGTNTAERISGGQGILSYLNKGNNIVFVSTHDIELTELLKKENYELFHFCEDINKTNLVFDHKLKKGKLTTRNAIKIMELYNYPEVIIEQAKQTLKTV
ncbi:MutS-related protein [Pontimicrobium sp. MEBiC01747]